MFFEYSMRQFQADFICQLIKVIVHLETYAQWQCKQGRKMFPAGV